MKTAQLLTAPPIATEAFADAAAAVDRLQQIYERHTAFLRRHFESYARGKPLESRVRATYPFVRITTGCSRAGQGY
jgi:AMP nucleosidase